MSIEGAAQLSSWRQASQVDLGNKTPFPQKIWAPLKNFDGILNYLTE